MKYIDAEKLIAEIKRRQEQSRKMIGGQSRVQLCRQLLDFIEFLQQEQPSPRWIHANYSDKPEIRHSPSGEPYLQSGPYMIWLSDLETLPKDGTDLTNPGPEQPEVDLEKEIDDWYNTMGIPVTTDALKETARHFWNKGYNARKERQ